MELDRSILKAFADVTNNTPTETNGNQYLRGTTKVIDDTKYVQLDGSETLTPISETVDIQDGDRVLVSIENHRATILGNFTFPPSARKTQDAIDEVGGVRIESSSASNKAQEALDAANAANTNSLDAITKAEEAINNAQGALDAANKAQQDTAQTKQDATDALTKSEEAKNIASQTQDALTQAQTEIDKVEEDIVGVQSNIADAFSQLETHSTEIKVIQDQLGITETYTTKVETDELRAELMTEISKQVGEIQTTISEEYAAKSEVTEIESALQTQITQNSNSLTTQVSRIDKIESDTADAQTKVDEAKTLASQAQTAADEAVSKANAAQSSADSAKANAENAMNKADEVEEKALQAAIDARVADEALTNAKTALDEAKKNYELAVNNPESTPEEIQQAQEQVDIATENVNTALETAATAAYAANQAQEAADKAIADAKTAKSIADDAQLKATNAQSSADAAKADVLKAQQDIAALNTRVTEAETSITQSSEQITLNATKTEEIGNKLDTDYYNKTQTDAAIQLSIDGVSSTVKQELLEEFDDTFATDTELQNGLETTKESYTSLIDQTAKQIDVMISDLKSITDDNILSITSLANQLQITSEMAQFVKTTTETLQSVIDDKVSETEIKEWARFDGATLELGASNQPFKCKLTTTELAFYQGANKVAWISNNELNILTAIIAKSIGCGNFTFIDEGDLGFSLL